MANCPPSSSSTCARRRGTRTTARRYGACTSARRPRPAEAASPASPPITASGRSGAIDVPLAAVRPPRPEALTAHDPEHHVPVLHGHLVPEIPVLAGYPGGRLHFVGRVQPHADPNP